MDVSRSVEAVTKLGPGHAVAILVIAILGGLGYYLLVDSSTEHLHLLEALHKLDVDMARVLDRCAR